MRSSIHSYITIQSLFHPTTFNFAFIVWVKIVSDDKSLVYDYLTINILFIYYYGFHAISTTCVYAWKHSKLYKSTKVDS